jgi:hypothetical protein
MNYLVRQPMIIKNMARLNDDYILLKRRRSTLLDELDDNSTNSRTLRSLRRSELHLLDKRLTKIDRFLIRYGFIRKGSKT